MATAGSGCSSETGFIISLRNSVEILYISWFVNCVVPAKLGDVYRAYLLKMNSAASLSRTFGTVFIERILDIFAIAILGLAAGFWSFRDGMPPAIRLVFIVGIVVVVVAAIGLFTMRNFGRRILDRLPLPPAILELYERFEEGVFGAVGLKHLPILAFVTGLIWLTEGLRLYIVVQAFGFPDVELGLSGAIFVALIGSLLTAIPLSPAGLGFAQAGVIGVLTVAYGIPLARGDGDHDPRLGHQRALDHRVRRRRCTSSRRCRAGWATSASHRRRRRLRRRPERPASQSADRRAVIRSALPDVQRSGGLLSDASLPDRRFSAPDRSRFVARNPKRDRYQRVIQASARPADSYRSETSHRLDPTERPGSI